MHEHNPNDLPPEAAAEASPGTVDPTQPRYAISFTPRAAQTFRKLDPDIRARIAPHIDALADEPRPPGAKLLHQVDARRIRVGDWRIVYSIVRDTLTVLVITLGHRSDIYRRLTA